MKGFIANIESLSVKNDNFRKVLYTGKHSQLVLMSIEPSGQIGEETHHDNDQFFRFESGEGAVVIDGLETVISDGFAVIVPAGAKHNIINTSKTIPLKLYTIYSPAHHRDGIIHKTKADAESDDEEFKGITTE